MTVRPNHLLAIIGTIMLVSAMVGAFIVEEEPAAANRGKRPKTFHISFPITNGTAGATGNVNDGTSMEVAVPVSDYNITAVVITVTWNDNQPILRPAAAVSVSIKDPSGNEVGSGLGSDGATGINIVVVTGTEVPKDLNISVKSQQDAQTWVNENYPTFMNSTGDWTVSLSVTRGGFSGPFRQGSVDWTADLQYPFYTADVKEASK
jgi:hypothetical protein